MNSGTPAQRLLAFVLLGFTATPAITVLYVSLSTPSSAGGIGGFGSLRGWNELWSLGMHKLVVQTVGIGGLAALVTVLLAARVSAQTRIWPAKRRRWVVRVVAAPLLVDLVVRCLATWRLLESVPVLASGWFSGAQVFLGAAVFSSALASIGLVFTYFPYAFLVFWSSAEALDDQLFMAARDLGAQDSDLVTMLMRRVFGQTMLYCWIILCVSMSADAVVPYVFGAGRMIMAAQGVEFFFFRLSNWPAAAALASLLVVSAATIGGIGFLVSQFTRSVSSRLRMTR